MLTRRKTKKTIFAAVSGGVDSSVSAALLKNEGYNVVGIYMKNWSGDNYGIQDTCPWEKDVRDAQAVCAKLKIPFKAYNFEREYRKEVVDYFFCEYENGRTPNPDVLCNREIKFKLFLERALSEGANLIATGHYARVKKENGEFMLIRGADENKDQTYFLHTFTQKQLSRVLFPIGHLKKSEVRKLASDFDLPTANKKDSQGICFIGDINVQNFLRSRIDTKCGDIVDIDTRKIVGRHDGVMFYTIGQRKGLRIGGSGEPYFIVGKNNENNELFVGKGENHPLLFRKSIKLDKIHWISGKCPALPIECEVSIRYRQKSVPAKIEKSDGKFEIIFSEPVRAVSPGQSAVIYQGEECLGGGVI